MKSLLYHSGPKGWDFLTGKRNLCAREEIDMGTPVTVPMVGKIVSVTVKVGDRVSENDQVAILEAMKMEMPIVSPITGTVKEVKVNAGQEVEAEAVIAVID
jgi:biotin carboxyl carrier protein